MGRYVVSLPAWVNTDSRKLPLSPIDKKNTFSSSEFHEAYIAWVGLLDELRNHTDFSIFEITSGHRVYYVISYSWIRSSAGFFHVRRRQFKNRPSAFTWSRSQCLLVKVVFPALKDAYQFGYVYCLGFILVQVMPRNVLPEFEPTSQPKTKKVRASRKRLARWIYQTIKQPDH